LRSGSAQKRLTRAGARPWPNRIEAPVVGLHKTKGQTMSNTNTNPPTHRVYAVIKNGKKNFWQAIGACWQHADGDGFTTAPTS
jgi:hypothetical protein